MKVSRDVCLCLCSRGDEEILCAASIVQQLQQVAASIGERHAKEFDDVVQYSWRMLTVTSHLIYLVKQYAKAGNKLYVTKSSIIK